MLANTCHLFAQRNEHPYSLKHNAEFLQPF